MLNLFFFFNHFKESSDVIAKQCCSILRVRPSWPVSPAKTFRSQPGIACIQLPNHKMGPERSHWWTEIASQWAEENHLNGTPRAPV